MAKLSYFYSFCVLVETLAPGAWPDALTYLPPVLFWFPPLLLWLFSFAGNKTGVALWNLLSLMFVMFVSPFGLQLVERTQKPMVERPLTILSWNILHGRLGSQEIADYVKQNRPDIALFQETQESVVMKELQEALPEYHLVRGGMDLDLAIFSRYPIRVVPSPVEFPGFLMQADAEIGETSLRVLNVHIGKASKSRTPVRSIWKTTAIHEEARKALAETLETVKGPVLLAGDFNAPSAAPLVRKLPLRELRSPGLGGTYPQRFPLWRIDHALVSQELNCERVWTDDIGYSDHRPVWLQLTFR